MDACLADLERTVLATAQHLARYRLENASPLEDEKHSVTVKAESKRSRQKARDAIVIDLTSDTEESTTSTKVEDLASQNDATTGPWKPSPDDEIVLVQVKFNTKRHARAGPSRRATKRSASPMVSPVIPKRSRHSADAESRPCQTKPDVADDKHAPDFFYNRRPATDEEVKTFLDDLKNPDIKVTVKQELCMEQIVFNRLTSHGIRNLKLELSEAMRTFTVTRAWMSKRFGGSANAMVSLIAQDRVERHGYDHFLYMNLAYHPDAPKRPGCAGLMYGVGGASAIPKIPAIARIFVNVRPSQWLYMGNYEVKEVESLTVEEWKKVPSKVRHKWAAEISTQSWARLFRIRTVLRRQHPSQDISTGDLYEQFKVDGKPYLDVTPQDVLETLDSGIEPFCVFTVKPLSYDKDLQTKLIEMHK